MKRKKPKTCECVECLMAEPCGAPATNAKDRTVALCVDCSGPRRTWTKYDTGDFLAELWDITCAKRDRPKKLESSRADPDHAWATRRGTPVCEACGVVRRADGRNKACAGRLPRIVLRVSVPMVVVVGAGSAARRLCDECAGTTFSIFYAECTLPCETCGAHPRPCFCGDCRPQTPQREWRPSW